MRRFFLAVVLFLSFSLRVSAQFAVIDVSSIAAAIENGYTMYQQLMNAYNQYKSLVQQVENQKKQMESISPSDYDWKQWDASLHMIDDYMTRMDNIEELYSKKSMNVGGYYFSLDDLYNNNAMGHIAREVVNNVDPKYMTQADLENFYQKHGLSYSHFRTLQGVVNELNTSSKFTIAKAQEMKKLDDAYFEESKEIKKKSGETYQQAKLAQFALRVSSHTLDGVLQAAGNTADITNLLCLSMRKQEVYDEIDQERSVKLNKEGNHEASPIITNSGSEEEYEGMGRHD